MKTLEHQLQRTRQAYGAAQQIEDVNERRRQAAASGQEFEIIAIS